MMTAIGLVLIIMGVAAAAVTAGTSWLWVGTCLFVAGLLILLWSSRHSRH